jgi:hypothetical protein
MPSVDRACRAWLLLAITWVNRSAGLSLRNENPASLEGSDGVSLQGATSGSGNRPRRPAGRLLHGFNIWERGVLSFSKRWRAPGRFLSNVPVSWALGPKIGPLSRTSLLASFGTRSEGVQNHYSPLLVYFRFSFGDFAPGFIEPRRRDKTAPAIETPSLSPKVDHGSRATSGKTASHLRGRHIGRPDVVPRFKVQRGFRKDYRQL